MTMTAKGLAKLIEECGELQQVAAKKLAYFNTDDHPDGAAPLSERMQEEIADVLAACYFVIHEFGLNSGVIDERKRRKFDLFREWHGITDNNVHAFDYSPSEANEVRST